MLRFLFSLTIILSVPPLAAQKIISTIKLGPNPIKDLRGFRSGDTLFISYLEDDLTLQQSINKVIYVYPSGDFENVRFKEIPNAIFCGFEKVNSKLYHYYLEKVKNKKTIIKALYLDKINGDNAILKDDISIQEKIIGVINNKGLLVVERDKAKNSIVLHKISEHKEVSKEEYILSNKYASLEASDFQLVSSTAGWIYEANGKFKIYPKDGKLFLTLDHKNGTDVVSYNDTKDLPNSLTIASPLNSYIKSFLSDSLIFRLTIFKKGFSVFVYRLKDGVLLSKKQFRVEDSMTDDKIYFHSGKENKTSHDENTSHMINLVVDYWATPSIIANKTPQNKYSITLGSYNNDKGTGVAGGANPIASLFIFMATSGIKQLREGPAQSRYLNATYDRNELSLNNDNELIFKKIDEFDINKNEGIKILDILITSTKSAYVITQNIKSNTLEIIKF